jgi:hypothetical protein
VDRRSLFAPTMMRYAGVARPHWEKLPSKNSNKCGRMDFPEQDPSISIV